MKLESFAFERCVGDPNYFVTQADQFFAALSSARKTVKVKMLKFLGTYATLAHLANLTAYLQTEKEQQLRLTAIEIIRKLKDPASIPALTLFLEDPNPLIVAQAFLGLWPFRTQAKIKARLQKFKNHPNEVVSDLALAAFTPTRLRRPALADNQALRNLVVQGDVTEILPLVPPDTIDLTFTSPPYYNARDYSIYPSYAAYLEFLEKLFAQLHKVTRPGRFFVLNTSPVIMPRVERQFQSRRYPIPFDLHPLIMNLGWEFIDDIVWAKPETSVKNRNGGFFQHRKPLAYKPNACTEYLMVYRKKCPELIDWNIKQYSTEIIQASLITDDYPRSNLWEIMPVATAEHSAVFPAELATNIIKLYSMKSDLIFDPFGGRGTTAVAAAGLGRNYFTTEISSEYTRTLIANLTQAQALGEVYSTKEFKQARKRNLKS